MMPRDSCALSYGGVLPTLPEPRAGGRVTGRTLLAGRAAARALGPVGAAAALAGATSPLFREFAVTTWRGKTSSTAAGTADRPGSGVPWRGRWPAYSAMLEAYANEVHPKGEGLILAHGSSIWGGSSDAELTGRTALFADNDSADDWRPIADVLDDLRLAYVLAVRRDGSRWHLTIPLTTLLSPPTPGDPKAASAWKQNAYAPQLGWLLGWLSELGQLDCLPDVNGKASDSHLGFDAANDRLLGLEYAVCRRTTDEREPRILARGGRGLDWGAALARTGYVPPVSASAPHGGERRARTVPLAVAPPDAVGDEGLVAALAGVRSAGWQRGHLDRCARALGGALAGVGFTPQRAGAVVAAAAYAAGCGPDAASMGVKAALVAGRVHDDLAAPGSGTLRRDYQELSDVLMEYAPPLPVATAHAVAEAPRLMTATVASAEIARVLGEAMRGEGGQITVVASTAGAGKSKVMAESIGALDEMATVVVPRHDLARQTVDRLRSIGVDAVAPRGVARVMLPLVGSPVCLFADEAELLARAGAHVRRTLCTECPHRENYRGTGAGCEAYGAGGVTGAVIVAQQSTLATILRARVAGEDSAARVTVVDESPALTMSVPLREASGRYEFERRRHAFDEGGLPYIEPLVRAVLRGARRSPKHGATIRELATAGADGDEVHVGRALAGATNVDTSNIWRRGTFRRLSVRVVAGDAGARAGLGRAADVHELICAIMEGAHTPDAPALRIDDEGDAHLVVPAAWLRAAREYRAVGGRLIVLDATAPVEAYRAVFGEVHVESIDVADAPGVTRVFIPWSSGARGRHVDDGVPRACRIRGALRALAKEARERSVRTLAIIADKPTAAALVAAVDAVKISGAVTPELIPAELALLIAGGMTVAVGYFGNQKGMDTWAAADMLATLGDPWPHVPEAQAEAAALGVDPDTWLRHLVQGELAQAHGRARPVHRATPVCIVCVGNVTPDHALFPQWAGTTTAPMPKGRPRTADAAGAPLDASGWASERALLGLSVREHARRLGVDRATYQRAVDETRRRNDAGGVGHDALRQTYPPLGGSKVHQIREALQQAQAQKPLTRTFEPPGGGIPGAQKSGVDLTFGPGGVPPPIAANDTTSAPRDRGRV